MERQFEEIRVSRAPWPARNNPDVISIGDLSWPSLRVSTEKYEAKLKEDGWTISAEVTSPFRILRFWRKNENH